jgi:Pyruvate/2-oxoacid:ferredoxin oxidoreductase delta subunit
MSDQSYIQIAENIDKGIQTAPKSDGELSKAFIAYLKIVYKPEEAEVVQHLGMLPQTKTAEEVISAVAGDPQTVQSTLDELKQRGFIAQTSKGGYCLPAIPNLVNLHMFYPELKPDDLEAARLYQDFFIKEKFYKYYATSGKGTPGLRAIPIEQSIAPEEKVFEKEEAHEFIKTLGTEDLVLVPCPCRVRTEKMDIRECRDKFPVGSCIMIGGTARYMENAGLGKRVTKEQAIEYLDKMVEIGLIATADNYLADPHNIMCLCCGCCCSNIRGRTRWDNPTAVLPSQFLPMAGDECTMCETCIDRCILDALSIDDDEGCAVADPEKCIGCGVCTIDCPEETLKLQRYERPEKPFNNMTEYFMTVASDNGRL